MAKILRSKQRAGSLRRTVKAIDSAADQLGSTRAALKKMFGPLTPAERRELNAVAKKLARDVERFLLLLARPRKRPESTRRTRKRGS